MTTIAGRKPARQATRTTSASTIADGTRPSNGFTIHVSARASAVSATADV